MPSRHLSFVLGLSLLGCAGIEREESPYNKGVEAYKAKNYAEARLQWSKALDEGEVLALNNLGYLMYYGLGGSADPDRAVLLWRKGALAGHSEAQWHLGRAFADGKGVERDYVQAYAWYRCALASAEAASAHNREVETEIAEGVRRSIVILVDRLSPAEFDSAARLANQYVAKYAKAQPTKP